MRRLGRLCSACMIIVFFLFYGFVVVLCPFMFLFCRYLFVIPVLWQNPVGVPDSLTRLKGKDLLFKVVVTEDHLNGKKSTFTVEKLTDDGDMVDRYLDEFDPQVIDMTFTYKLTCVGCFDMVSGLMFPCMVV